MNDFDRAGRAVKRRRQDLGLTQEEAAVASEGLVSSSNWRVFEAGKRDSYRRPTLLGICRVLGWTDDSIERLLEGQEPVLAVGLRAVGAVRQQADRIRSGDSDDDPTLAALSGDTTLTDVDRRYVMDLVKRLRAG